MSARQPHRVHKIPPPEEEWYECPFQCGQGYYASESVQRHLEAHARLLAAHDADQWAAAAEYVIRERGKSHETTSEPQGSVDQGDD